MYQLLLDEIKKIIVEKNQSSPKGWDYLLCPHTATAAYTRDRFLETPFIIVATAHPSKFPDIVKKSINQYPDLPRNLIDLLKRKEKYETIELNYYKVKNYLLKQSNFVKNV